MTAQLDALGLPWVRVPAVDGATLGPLPWPDYDERGYDLNWGKSPNPNEVGCYFSHLRALETFLKDGMDFGLILEDDCVFDADVVDVLNDVVAAANRWDVVKLAGIHSGMPALVERLPHGRSLVAYLQRQTGAAAYLVNRKAAMAYLNKLRPMNVPWDHAYDQVWRFGLTLRGVRPLPVRDAVRRSTIGYEHHAHGRKKTWYLRGGVLAYRTRTEIRRVLHYLFTDTRWLTRWFVPTAR
jgi:glycosyl transferase family 25